MPLLAAVCKSLYLSCVFSLDVSAEASGALLCDLLHDAVVLGAQFVVVVLLEVGPHFILLAAILSHVE